MCKFKIKGTIPGHFVLTTLRALKKSSKVDYLAVLVINSYKIAVLS